MPREPCFCFANVASASTRYLGESTFFPNKPEEISVKITYAERQVGVTFTGAAAPRHMAAVGKAAGRKVTAGVRVTLWLANYPVPKRESTSRTASRQSPGKCPAPRCEASG